MSSKCSAALFQKDSVDVSSIASPTASPKSSPRSANSTHHKNRQRLAGYVPITAGLETEPWGRLAHSARDVVALDFLVHGGTVDSQNGGGLLDVAAGALNRGDDQLLLHFLKGHAGGDGPSLARQAVQCQKGEVLVGQFLAPAGHQGAFHCVFQLAYVAGPVVVDQDFEGAIGDLADVLAELVRKPFHEMTDQQGNVLAAFAQRRDADFDHVQAIKEIVAELALGNR